MIKTIKDTDDLLILAKYIKVHKLNVYNKTRANREGKDYLRNTIIRAMEGAFNIKNELKSSAKLYNAKVLYNEFIDPESDKKLAFITIPLKPKEIKCVKAFTGMSNTYLENVQSEEMTLWDALGHYFKVIFAKPDVGKGKVQIFDGINISFDRIKNTDLRNYAIKLDQSLVNLDIQRRLLVKALYEVYSVLLHKKSSTDYKNALDKCSKANTNLLGTFKTFNKISRERDFNEADVLDKLKTMINYNKLLAYHGFTENYLGSLFRFLGNGKRNGPKGFSTKQFKELGGLTPLNKIFKKGCIDFNDLKTDKFCEIVDDEFRFYIDNMRKAFKETADYLASPYFRRNGEPTIIYKVKKQNF